MPRMILSNAHKHRAGRKGQGNASLTKTVRDRIHQVYNAKWEQLLAQPTPAMKRAKKNCEAQQAQRDKQDIANIMQHLKDNELTQALRVLNGPPELAKPEQIMKE
jgi:hypothetical protein